MDHPTEMSNEVYVSTVDASRNNDETTERDGRSSWWKSLRKGARGTISFL